MFSPLFLLGSLFLALQNVIAFLCPLQQIFQCSRRLCGGPLGGRHSCPDRLQHVCSYNTGIVVEQLFEQRDPLLFGFLFQPREDWQGGGDCFTDGC
jgi:hypothetical protein